MCPPDDYFVYDQNYYDATQLIDCVINLMYWDENSKKGKTNKGELKI